MTVIGKRYICDRCKSEVFVRYIGTKEIDGGWTQIRNFEKPENWTWEHDIGDLCPKYDQSSYLERAVAFCIDIWKEAAFRWTKEGD